MDTLICFYLLLFLWDALVNKIDGIIKWWKYNFIINRILKLTLKDDYLKAYK